MPGLSSIQTVVASTVGTNSSEHWRLQDEEFHERQGRLPGQRTTQSLWGRLKVGRLYGRKFEIRRKAMDEVIDSTLGYVSPMQFEESWHATQLLRAA